MNIVNLFSSIQTSSSSNSSKFRMLDKFAMILNAAAIVNLISSQGCPDIAKNMSNAHTVMFNTAIDLRAVLHVY